MFAKVFAATALAAVLAQSVLAKDCNRKYTIVQGDICDSISAAHNVSTYQLATINAGVIDKDCGNLMPGEEICLGYGDEDCTKTYVVKADDTMEIVAAATGVNSTMITLNNPQIDAGFTNVYIGEVLCVADTVTVPPPTTVVTHATSVPSGATKVQTTTKHDDDEDDEDDEDLPYCEDL